MIRKKKRRVPAPLSVEQDEAILHAGKQHPPLSNPFEVTPDGNRFQPAFVQTGWTESNKTKNTTAQIISLFVGKRKRKKNTFYLSRGPEKVVHLGASVRRDRLLFCAPRRSSQFYTFF